MLSLDAKVVLLAAGLMFLWALLLGVVKFQQMAAARDGLAHPYVDTAHRAALLYSFALGLIAAFVQLSGFATAVNLVAAGALAGFFYAAVAGYTIQGLRGRTDNQFRAGEGPLGLHGFMWLLVVAEVAGMVVLLAGFVVGQL